MAALGTQKTPDQAAALIQARVRGQKQRRQDQRAIHAVTRLQARQRARYTRREFQKLLEFYNEQDSFLQESKRRQLRLWHREQELYLLQHTTADELDAIRAFQYTRSARRIQREWRRLHPTPLEDVDVSGLGRPFDPFGLRGDSDSDSFYQPNGRSPWSVIIEELYGDLPRQPVAAVDEHKAARRRAEIQERLQRRRKEKDKETRKRGANPPTRRELFTELVSLREATAERVKETREVYRSHRAARDLEAARLSASCRNRVTFLLDDSRVNLLGTTRKDSGRRDRLATEVQALANSTDAWSDNRKRSAWTNHTRVVNSVLGKHKWFETSIAGETRDIRRVYAASPWPHDKQVWQWPPSSDQPHSEKEEKIPVFGDVTAMDRIMFCLQDENESNNQEDHLVDTRPLPIDDTQASVWWKAHATQSHARYERLQQRRLQLLRSGSARSNNHSEDAHVTPEMLVNPQFYEFYKRALDVARQKETAAAVNAKLAHLQHQIRHKVVDVETHIEMNTRRFVEEREQKLQQKARQTKEERSARQIQRIARGKLGRQKANEHRALYFVLVRGRAIRKGKCEECGAQPAVLECRECEESLHFCPVCWVQVHATRRRKTHVPIPMAVEKTQILEARGNGTTVAKRPEPVRAIERDVEKEGRSKLPISLVALMEAAPRREVEASTRAVKDSRESTGEPRMAATRQQKPDTAIRKTPVVASETVAANKTEVVTETKTAVTVPEAEATGMRTRTDLVSVGQELETGATEGLNLEQDRASIDTVATVATAPVSAKAAAPEPTVTAKPKGKEVAKPRMSLRQRMTSEKAPSEPRAAPQTEADQPRPPQDATPSNLGAIGIVLDPPTATDGPPLGTRLSRDRNVSEQDAARKIQSLHRQRLARKHEPTNKPDQDIAS